MTYKVTMWIHREVWVDQHDYRRLIELIDADGPLDALTKLDNKWRRLPSDDISFGPTSTMPQSRWRESGRAK